MYEAVLLAGGKSRRMGRDKLALPQNGTTVLQAAAQRFSQKFDRVYLSVDDISRYPEIKLPKIADIYKNCGPLGGLHASLSKCEGEGIFLAASDLPFSSPDIALEMIKLANEYDICVTRDENGRYEPLFAFYKKSVLAAVCDLLEKGVYKMTALYDSHRVLTVTPEMLGEKWSAQSFENMNYPEDFQRLLGK